MRLCERPGAEEQVDGYIFQEVLSRHLSPLWYGRRRLQPQQIIADLDHAELLKLLFSVSIWLCKGFTYFTISVILGTFYLALKANYFIVVYLLGLDKHVAEGSLSIIYLVILVLRHKGVIDVVKCQPSEGICGHKEYKGVV